MLYPVKLLAHSGTPGRSRTLTHRFVADCSVPLSYKRILNTDNSHFHTQSVQQIVFAAVLRIVDLPFPAVLLIVKPIRFTVTQLYGNPTPLELPDTKVFIGALSSPLASQGNMKSWPNTHLYLVLAVGLEPT